MCYVMLHSRNEKGVTVVCICFNNNNNNNNNSNSDNVRVFHTVSYTMDTLYFTWIEKPVDIEPTLQLPQFALRGYIQKDCSQNYTAG